MRSVSTILYTAAVITFIGWLLYRVRHDSPAADAAPPRREPPTESRSEGNGRDPEAGPADATADPAPVGPGDAADRKASRIQRHGVSSDR